MSAARSPTRLLKRDKVDFMTGLSGRTSCSPSYQPIIQSGTILISANAGPHQIAGEQCAPNFFSASWQNDQTPEAMGKFMQDQKMHDVYLIAPDYAAGRDMMTGFKRYFKDKIAAETYTKFGQSDYQVEISQIRDANPKAVFVFLPGGMGIQFVKQYAKPVARDDPALFGLHGRRDDVAGDRRSGVRQLRGRLLGARPRQRRATRSSSPRSARNTATTRPTMRRRASTRSAMIDHAVKAVKGDIANKKAMIAALEKADFPSVRGKFKYNNNHFPIEDFYLLRIGKDKDGNYVRMIEKKVFDDHADSYADECKMKGYPAGPRFA